MNAPRLVSTGVAARETGVDPRVLQRWAARRLITPELRTAGGHRRWDLNDLRRQLARLGEQSEERPS